jgi:hypothetical protein
MECTATTFLRQLGQAVDRIQEKWKKADATPVQFRAAAVTGLLELAAWIVRFDKQHLQDLGRKLFIKQCHLTADRVFKESEEKRIN